MKCGGKELNLWITANGADLIVNFTVEVGAAMRYGFGSATVQVSRRVESTARAGVTVPAGPAGLAVPTVLAVPAGAALRAGSAE